MLELPVEDLGELDYAAAYQRQCDVHAQVLAARPSFEAMPHSGQWPHLPGRLLLVEHVPPVITVSNRPNAAAHLLASRQQLERLGVTVAQTDRGGDITYHGPGQLVAYPILDLNVLRLRLHDYLRLLEAVIIDLLASLEIPAQRDSSATGVWVPTKSKNDTVRSRGKPIVGSADDTGQETGAPKAPTEVQALPTFRFLQSPPPPRPPKSAPWASECASGSRCTAWH